MRTNIPARVAALREAMNERKIDAYIIPSSDPHLSEYPADRWKAREWISGFNGSAGTVVVTAHKAGLWTDSRYFLAAAEQLAGTPFRLMKERVEGTPTVAEWLAEVLPPGSRVGIDGWTGSVDDIRNAIKNGHMNEAFGSGTAAVISPVGVLGIDGEDGTVVTIIDGYWAFDGVKSEYPATPSSSEVHEVKISEDGYWMIWDAEKGEYVTTTYAVAPVSASQNTNGSWTITIKNADGTTSSINIPATGLASIELDEPQDWDDYYASNSVSINEVYENFARNFDADVCVYTNATSPLIKDVTIENCIDLYLNNSEEHDSCNTVNSVKLFLWKDGKPINYDVNNKPRSQDLPEIVAINHSVNVLSRETLLKRREVVGLRPIFYTVDQMEGVDIDVDIDFQFAEFMYRKYILNEQI